MQKYDKIILGDNMKSQKREHKIFDKIMKHKNLFVVVCVLALTGISISFSYASFFTVKTNTNNQTIKTGTLEVSYGNDSSSILRTNLFPVSDEIGMSESDSSLIYVQNTGTLDSSFVLNIGYDMDNFTKRSGYLDSDRLTPIDYIRIAVYEYNGAGEEETLLAGPLSISDLTIYKKEEDSRYNRYSLLLGEVGGTNSTKATKTYRVKMWLSDEAGPAASYTYFFVNTEIVAGVKNAEMSYKIEGKLFTNSEDTPINSPKVILENATVAQNEDNKFVFDNVVPGNYNLRIINGDKINDMNIMLVEGNTKSVEKVATSFMGDDIYNVAYSYGTTVSKILASNNLSDSYADVVNFDSNTAYNLPSVYKITIPEGSDKINIQIKALHDEDGNITDKFEIVLD